MYKDVLGDLVDYLVDNTKDTEYELQMGKNLFVGHMPPNRQLTLTLVQQSPVQTYNYNKHVGEELYPIRMQIRGNQREDDTRSFAKALHDLLQDRSDEPGSDYRIIWGRFETKPYQIEPRDAENNFIYVALYEILIEEV